MTNEQTLFKVRDCLVKLSKGRGALRGDGLADRVSKLTKIPVAEVIPAFSTLRQNNELTSENWFNELPLSMVTLDLMEAPEKPSYKRWLSAMGNAGFSNDETKALSRASEILSELNEKDLGLIAEGLKKLKQDQYNLMGLAKYPVSARYLIGSSKLLDSLPTNLLKEFGVEVDSFLRPVSYVIVAGPANPDIVVLVENPQAMEIALKADIPNIAWIATFGYGLSMMGDEYGRQLASIVEDERRLIQPLIRSGNPPLLDELFTYKNIYFWGDLDPEGLRIYTRIKSKLPNLKLSGLYNPMFSYLLNSELHHPYIKITGKNGQAAWKSSEPEINDLIEQCHLRGVDQEILKPTDIKKFAQRQFAKP